MDLRAIETAPPLMLVGLQDSRERVEFSDEALAKAITAACPNLRDYARIGRPGRLLVGAVAVVVGTILTAVFGVPLLADFLAPMLPDAVERRFGESVESQIVRLLGSPEACERPEGQAALDRMIAALTPGRVAGDPGVGALTRSVHVGVRRSAPANALTLPGGRIIVLSKLIREAKSPDEFAGVVAHELGHVAARDSTRAMIRASGVSFLLSYLFGDFTGATIVVALGSEMISAHYGRDAERAADAYAVETMMRAGADGAALATILERITKDESEDAPLLRSHPFTRERAAAIRAQAATQPVKAPILDEADWKALRSICGAPAKPH